MQIKLKCVYYYYYLKKILLETHLFFTCVPKIYYLMLRKIHCRDEY